MLIKSFASGFDETFFCTMTQAVKKKFKSKSMKHQIKESRRDTQEVSGKTNF